MAGGQRAPAPAVPGQSVQRQNLHGTSRAPAVKVEVGHRFMVPVADRVVGPPWCHADMTKPMLAPEGMHPSAVLAPGLRGTVRIVGGPGSGKSTLLVHAAAEHIAAGMTPSRCCC